MTNKKIIKIKNNTFENISKRKQLKLLNEYLKNKYGENLNLSLLVKMPKLYDFLVKNPKGEESYFHFGKHNSPLSQLNAALSQKYI